MRRALVRYKVKPEAVAENEKLVRAVYEELRQTQPAGMRYATFQLDDGVSFVHINFSDGASLNELASFRAFQEGIAERCDEQPRVSELREIGSYRFDADA
jgi:quinol monooxygenase YgiN